MFPWLTVSHFISASAVTIGVLATVSSFYYLLRGLKAVLRNRKFVQSYRPDPSISDEMQEGVDLSRSINSFYIKKDVPKNLIMSFYWFMVGAFMFSLLADGEGSYNVENIGPVVAICGFGSLLAQFFIMVIRLIQVTLPLKTELLFAQRMADRVRTRASEH